MLATKSSVSIQTKLQIRINTRLVNIFRPYLQDQKILIYEKFDEFYNKP